MVRITDRPRLMEGWMDVVFFHYKEGKLGISNKFLQKSTYFLKRMKVKLSI